MIVFARTLSLMIGVHSCLCFSMSSLDDGYIRNNYDKVKRLYDECVGTSLQKKLQEFANADMKEIKSKLSSLANGLKEFEAKKERLENSTTEDPRIIDAAVNEACVFALNVSDKIMSKNVLSFYNDLPEDTRLVIEQYVPMN